METFSTRNKYRCNMCARSSRIHMYTCRHQKNYYLSPSLASTNITCVCAITNFYCRFLEKVLMMNGDGRLMSRTEWSPSSSIANQSQNNSPGSTATAASHQFAIGELSSLATFDLFPQPSQSAGSVSSASTEAGGGTMCMFLSCLLSHFLSSLQCIQVSKG